MAMTIRLSVRDLISQHVGAGHAELDRFEREVCDELGVDPTHVMEVELAEGDGGEDDARVADALGIPAEDREGATWRLVSPAALSDFDRWACARCVAWNLAVATAVVAAATSLGLAHGIAVKYLMTKFGISKAAAIAAVGGANAAAVARALCKSC